MTTRTTTRARINVEISKMGTYHDSIPMDEIMTAIEKHGGMVVDEAGERWSGIFCGETGRANMEVRFSDMKPMYVFIGWYKMQSGRYEITCYVS